MSDIFAIIALIFDAAVRALSGPRFSALANLLGVLSFVLALC
jgi:hypothetical protein